MLATLLKLNPTLIFLWEYCKIFRTPSRLNASLDGCFCLIIPTRMTSIKWYLQFLVWGSLSSSLSRLYLAALNANPLSPSPHSFSALWYILESIILCILLVCLFHIKKMYHAAVTSFYTLLSERVLLFILSSSNQNELAYTNYPTVLNCRGVIFQSLGFLRPNIT